MTKCDFKFLTRKKKFDDESVSASGLRRVMGVLDVTAIGILFETHIYLSIAR